MKKLYFQLGFVLLLGVLVLVACAQQAAPAPEQPATQEEQPAEEAAPAAEEAPAEEAAPAEAGGGRFGLVLSGPIDDNSWNEAAYNALKALEADGVEVTFAERVAYADGARVLRELADAGYPMIVAHSFGYQDAVFEVGEEFPEVNLAWAGGIERTAKNVADYDQPFYQAAYLVGIIAGHVSESGKLGAVYGFDIPVCHAMGEALLAGAKTVNPEATLTFAAAGDWYDAAKAKEAALAQAETGVDYWVSCGEGPTLGTFEAAKEAGGYATGYVGDMTESGPEVVLTNIIWNLEPMFRDMLQQTQDGTFDAPYYRYGIKEGALDISINPGLADVIPAEALEQVEAAKAQIQSGEFEVPFVPQ
jgi:simple sugar transport system substrate-binding protein/basic membrane protein A